MLQESFDQSHEDVTVNNTQTVNQHQTVFQKYARVTSNNTQGIDNNQLTRIQSQKVVIRPNKVVSDVVQSNIQILSEEEGQKQSLIEKVEKQDFNDLQFGNQNGRGLVGIPQSNSKIIHRPITQHQIYQKQQMNAPIVSNQNPQINYQMQQQSNQNSFNQQNVLRHTISSGQNIVQRNNNFIPVAQQQTNIRGSLPPNMNPPQFFMNQQQGYNIQQQQQNNIQNVRLPQHMPQTLIPTQNIQGQNNQGQNNIRRVDQQQNKPVQPVQFKPVDFIQQNQQRLQKSQLVYTNRNPNINGNQQINNNAINNHYVSQNNQNNNSQPHRGQSHQNMRGNTRSLQRRATNVVFNYNSQGNSTVNMNQIPRQQPQFISPPPVQVIQQQRPVSLSPQPVNPVPIIPVVQQSSVPKVKSEPNWKQKYFALYSRFSQVNKRVEFVTQQFLVYQKLISTITIKQQKIITRQKKLRNTIQQLQQQCTSIVHEWKPTSQTKQLPTNQKKDQEHIEMKYKRLLFNFSKLQEENALIKNSFQQKINQVVKHLQSQNQQLKITLQKVTEGIQLQNKLMKKTSYEYLKTSQKNNSSEIDSATNLQDWVNNVGQIIQAVQSHNEELQERYLQMQEQINQKNEQIQHLTKLLAQNDQYHQSNEKPQQIAQSDELTFSVSQKLQLQQSNTKYHQKSVFLQGQVQRLQQQNKKLIISIRQKQTELKKTQSTLGNQNLTQLIEEMNIKIQQYQLKLTHIEESNIQLTTRNEQLQVELKQVISQLQRNKLAATTTTQPQIINVDNSVYLRQIQLRTRQVSELQIQKISSQQKNTVLRDQLQRLNSKISSLEINIKEFQSQISIQSQQHTQQQQQQITNQLSSTSTSIQQSPLIIQQYQFTISALRSQITRKQNQLQRQSKLNDQRNHDLTQQLKISYKQRQSIQKRYDQKILNLQNDKQKRQLHIRQLRDKIYQLQQKRKLQDVEDNRRNQYVNKMASYSQNQQTSKLRSQIQTLRTQKQRLSKDSQLQTKKLDDQIQQLKQDNIRLKKQINEFANNMTQVQNLTEIVNKKNIEILQLKSHLFQNQKLTVENNNFRKQIQRQSQENGRITNEYERVNKSFIDVTRSLRQLEQSINSVNNKFNSLQGEYNLALEANDRKDHQIVKLRQANQLLQTNVDEIQKQNEKLKIKIRNLQVTFEHQSTLMKQQIQNLKLKMNDYDKLIRQKSISDHRITQLQSIVQKYQYQLKQKDQLLIKQKTKIKTLQSQNQDISQQIQTVNQKLKQGQKKSTQSNKKYKKLIQQLQEKNKSLQQKQIKYEKQKITQLQHDVKSKENKIWKLEKQVQELLERLDQIGDQQIDGQKIAILQQKVKQYQSRLFNQTFKYSPSNYDYQATKVFERKVIYQLKEENQRLKQYLNQKKVVKPTTDKTNSNGNNNSKAQIQIKQAYDQQLDEVQGRLFAFNTKLQSLINNGSYQNIQVNNNKKSRQSPSRALIINNANNNNNIAENTFHSITSNKNETSQLRQLKLKYSELQRYCKNIEVQLLSGTTQVNQKSITSTQTLINTSSTGQNIIHDQITFHKQKNVELQERVDKLLKMNTQLKQNLEQLLKQRSQGSSVTYYKEQILQLNQKINILEIRIKSLLDENQKIKSQFGHLSKGEQNTQSKLFDYERRIIELQRLINQLNLSKNSLDKQLQSYRQTIQSKDYEIRQLRNQLSSHGDKQSSSLSSYRQKLQTQQIQMTKLMNRLRINQSQIERLNQIIKKRQSQSTQQINRWRVKVNQLQQEITRVERETQSQISGQSSIKIQISRLTQQLRVLQYQNQQLKSINQNLNRKLQQSDNKYREIQSECYQLEHDLLNKRVDQSQWNMKFDQYQAENIKFRNQIQILKSEIQRLNQQIKTRQRNFDLQLQSLHGKINLAQRQQLNLRKNSSSWDGQKYQYQTQVARLKTQIAMFGAQIQRRDSQYTNMQSKYQQKLTFFKNQIYQLQANSTTLQQSTSSWNIAKQRYQSQIIQLKNQTSILMSQIQRIKGISQEKESLYMSLQRNNSSWSDEKDNYERQITRLSNQTEIMRQQIQRLKFTIVEKQSVILGLTSSRQSWNIDKQSWNSERQHYEIQITRLNNQISLVKQQNQRLNSIINELQKSSLSADSNLTVQLNLLKRQNSQLLVEIQSMKLSFNVEIDEYRNKIQSILQQHKALAYYIELARSVYLEVQALVDQQKHYSEEQRKSISSRTNQEIHKGINILVQLSQILNSIY